jgi:hypothetical protein
MKTIKIIILLLFATAGISKAQDYNTGIGVRLGGWAGSGLSIKHFVHNDRALEFLVTSYYYRGATLTGLYEKHQMAFREEGLNFFYGAGAHVGAYGRGRYRYYYYDDRVYDNGFVVVGVDAIIGLEYKIPTIPFTIGADLHPLIELVNYPGWIALDGAVTFRYAF